MFSDGALMKHGWNKFQSNIPTLIGAAFVWLVLSILPFIIGVISQEGWFIVLMFFLAMFLSIFLGIGFMRMVISISDNDTTEFSTLFSGLDVFLSFVAVVILYTVIVMVGTLMLIVPGMIWGIQFMFAPFLVVDKKMGPIEALKRSSEMTYGMKWDLFAFQVMTSQVLTLATYALLLPLLVALPVVMVAYAGLYRQFAK